MINLHVDPTGTFSRAMTRIAAALRRTCPPGVNIVSRREDADVCLFYVIGGDAFGGAHECHRRAQQYIPLQCCLGGLHEPATGANRPVEPSGWSDFWKHALMVWSYYDLTDYVPPGRFYHSPLGIDEAFVTTGASTGVYQTREYAALTTGYVTGPGAEAIEEVWTALARLGLRGFHVGPTQVQGMAIPRHWESSEGLSDQALSWMFLRTQWVPALRYIEGFELPAAEGLACGCRPILFDQPTLRHWYNDHAIFIPECSGESLVRALMPLLATQPDPVGPKERQRILERFSWDRICEGFWSKFEEAVNSSKQEVVT